MSDTVWKFPLKVEDEQMIEAPFGMIPLSVQVQHGIPVLYGLVDPAINSPVMYPVLIHGTGHPVDLRWADYFVGSFQLYGGDFVGHVFCKGARE